MLIVEDGTGLSDSNSYVTLEEANERVALIYAGTLSSWTGIASATRQSYLIRAAEIINLQNFVPFTPVNREQAMPFPASRDLYNNNRRNYGRIPVILKNAQIELAYTYIETPVFPEDTSNIRSVTLGNLGIEYQTRSATQATDQSIIPARILALLRPLLSNPNSVVRTF